MIAGNCPEVQEGGTKFIYDYVGIHRPKDFSRKIFEILRKTFPDLTKQEVRKPQTRPMPNMQITWLCFGKREAA